VKSPETLLDSFIAGELTREQFLAALPEGGVQAFDEVALDSAREERCGFPEVVFAEGKSIETLLKIAEAMIASETPLLATRVSSEQATALLAKYPQGKHNASGRTLRIDTEAWLTRPRTGDVVVVSAGSSDLPVAEEARETLDWIGVTVAAIHDVGVAGPHRLPRHVPRLREADAIVVVAGMEGALPSVVGGYVSCPVIAVPTSVGYGANFGGLAALLGMLNSCAANVAVVNIDAGFKAGYLAGLIATKKSD